MSNSIEHSSDARIAALLNEHVELNMHNYNNEDVYELNDFALRAYDMLKELQHEAQAFKNFHRLLCERVGYTHDEQHWRRDQLSLVEWIAERKPVQPTMVPVLTAQQREAAKFALGLLTTDVALDNLASVSDLHAMYTAEPSPTGDLLAGVEVDAYVLKGTHWTKNITVQRAPQRQGADLWKVTRNGDCLNKSERWENEPSPSGRDDEFLARCRFDTLDAALAAAKQARLKD